MCIFSTVIFLFGFVSRVSCCLFHLIWFHFFLLFSLLCFCCLMQMMLICPASAVYLRSVFFQTPGSEDEIHTWVCEDWYVCLYSKQRIHTQRKAEMGFWEQWPGDDVSLCIFPTHFLFYVVYILYLHLFIYQTIGNIIKNEHIFFKLSL